MLETSAGTHKPMQNWDKLKKAIASRKERQTSQPNASLIPTRDRPLGQLQSHLAQVWSWARRRCWHQASSSSKSGLQLNGLLTRTDSDGLVTPSTMNGQSPISETLQVRWLWGHCDPWAPWRAERALCACVEKRVTAHLLTTQKHAGNAHCGLGEETLSSICSPRSKGRSVSRDACGFKDLCPGAKSVPLQHKVCTGSPKPARGALCPFCACRRWISQGS